MPEKKRPKPDSASEGTPQFQVDVSHITGLQASYSNIMVVCRLGAIIQFDFGQINLADMIAGIEAAKEGKSPVRLQALNFARFAVTAEAFLNAWPTLKAIQEALEAMSKVDPGGKTTK